MGLRILHRRVWAFESLGWGLRVSCFVVFALLEPRRPRLEARPPLKPRISEADPYFCMRIEGPNMSYSLNSLKGGDIGDYVGEFYRGY